MSMSNYGKAYEELQELDRRAYKMQHEAKRLEEINRLLVNLALNDKLPADHVHDIVLRVLAYATCCENMTPLEIVKKSLEKSLTKEESHDTI